MPTITIPTTTPTIAPSESGLVAKGYTVAGWKHTPESIEKIRNSSTGRVHSEETKARISSTKLQKKYIHSEETKLKISNSKTGSIYLNRTMNPIYKHSVAERAKLSARNHANKDLPGCSCFIHKRYGQNTLTRPHKQLLRLLKEFEVIIEKRFGRFSVDAYLPEYHLAFEADGERYHDSEYDKNRDKILLEEFNLIVVRLSAKELEEMEKSKCLPL